MVHSLSDKNGFSCEVVFSQSEGKVTVSHDEGSITSNLLELKAILVLAPYMCVYLLSLTRVRSR